MKTTHLVQSSESKLATSLIQMLREGCLLEVVRASRRYRQEGYRGAVFFELLALLHFRKMGELHLARKLVTTISANDLYPLDPEFAQNWPNLQQFLEAASWVLHYELQTPPQGMQINPALRVQELAFLEAKLGRLGQAPLMAAMTVERLSLILDKSGISRSEQFARIAEVQIQQGEISGAFSSIRTALAVDQSQVRARWVGHRLFPLRSKDTQVNILEYDGKGSCKAFGLASFPGQGFLIKEFTGIRMRPVGLLVRDVTPISPVNVLPWREGWGGETGDRGFQRWVSDELEKWRKSIGSEKRSAA